MSIGLQLIRSIVEAGAQTAFRQCYPIWFSEEETPVFRFVFQHVQRFGRLPSISTLQENGMALPRAPELPTYYLSRVRDRAMFTQLQQLHPSFLEAIKHKNIAQAIQTLRQMLANSQAVNPTRDITSIAEQGRLVIEAYEVAHRTYNLLGVTLGWQCVDDVTEGGQPGDVLVLVGRPGVGKTMALLWQIKKAWAQGKSILLCSMEMGPDQIARRVVGLQSRLNPQVIRAGRLSSWGENLMRNTVADFDDMPPFNLITGNFRKRVSDIEKAAEELQPDLIVVDAGYLVTPDKQSGQRSRREVISDVIEELKGVAINRSRPLLTSVQFNREVKRVHRGALELGSIAESDVIAQVASIVIGLRQGDTPYQTTRRRFEMLKNREGRVINFETNFSFAPVDLSFIRLLVEDEAANAEARPDMSHMA